jgi:hypothetical protein
MKTDAGKVYERRNDLDPGLLETFGRITTTRHHHGLRELTESAVLKFGKRSDDFEVGD